jgi:hypothetical protein
MRQRPPWGVPPDGWKNLLLLVFFLFFEEIAVLIKILSLLLFIFLEVLFLEFVGDGIERDRMSLRNLQFGLALWTAKDLSLLNFVFVDVNFSGTFRATKHGPSSDRT